MLLFQVHEREQANANHAPKRDGRGRSGVSRDSTTFGAPSSQTGRNETQQECQQSVPKRVLPGSGVVERLEQRAQHFASRQPAAVSVLDVASRRASVAVRLSA